MYLYPTGMAAIWNAHQTICLEAGSKKHCIRVFSSAKWDPRMRSQLTSTADGFTVDSVKVLEKWGLGCHFFGFGHEDHMNVLEALLETETKNNPGCPPIMCLITEFPSNPLLRSPNLRRLRELADKYEFSSERSDKRCSA